MDCDLKNLGTKKLFSNEKIESTITKIWSSGWLWGATAPTLAMKDPPPRFSLGITASIQGLTGGSHKK